MADDPTNTALVRITDSSIARYSNALIRRTIVEISSNFPDAIRAGVKKHSILVIAATTNLGMILKEILQADGYEVKIIEADNRLFEVYDELARNEYQILIPTNNSLTPAAILELVPEVTLRFPKIKMVVLSGFQEPEFMARIKTNSISDFFPLPFKIDEFRKRIKELLHFES